MNKNILIFSLIIIMVIMVIIFICYMYFNNDKKNTSGENFMDNIETGINTQGYKAKYTKHFTFFSYVIFSIRTN